MEILVVARPALRPEPKRLAHFVQKRKRAPVERRPDVVAALRGIRRGVPPALHDVDLAACRPRAIRIVHGQHPNSRPQPVTPRQPCADIHASILDRRTVYRREARRLHRVDDRARRLV